MRRKFTVAMLLLATGLSLSGCWREGRPGYPGQYPHHHDRGDHDHDHDHDHG